MNNKKGTLGRFKILLLLAVLASLIAITTASYAASTTCNHRWEYSHSETMHNNYTHHYYQTINNTRYLRYCDVLSAYKLKVYKCWYCASYYTSTNPYDSSVTHGDTTCTAR